MICCRAGEFVQDRPPHPAVRPGRGQRRPGLQLLPRQPQPLQRQVVQGQARVLQVHASRGASSQDLPSQGNEDKCKFFNYEMNKMFFFSWNIEYEYHSTSNYQTVNYISSSSHVRASALHCIVVTNILTSERYCAEMNISVFLWNPANLKYFVCSHFIFNITGIIPLVGISQRTQLWWCGMNHILHTHSLQLNLVNFIDETFYQTAATSFPIKTIKDHLKRLA